MQTIVTLQGSDFVRLNRFGESGPFHFLAPLLHDYQERNLLLDFMGFPQSDDVIGLWILSLIKKVCQRDRRPNNRSNKTVALK